ncbi:hypothetical protein FB639_003440, partial [Coemansia asiatica]
LPEGASRYETHTLSSFARAQARVSDRIALYNELGQTSMRQGAGPLHADTRRTQSFGAEANSAIAGLGLGLSLRPASALEDNSSDSRFGMPLRNELLALRAADTPERPHSAMGLMSPVQKQNHHRHQPQQMQGLGSRTRGRRASSVASTATRDGVEMSPAAGSCVFEVDRVRGTLFARLSENRRYRLTVWFSVPASADSLPAAGADFWESGSVAISGIPRSLNTRVRVRMPHRLPPEAEDDLLAGATTTGRCFYAVRMVQPPRVEPQSTRTVDAYAASSAVSHGRALPLPPPSLLFVPGSPALPSAQSSDTTAAGWLLTDDSDADSEAEADAAEMLASRSNSNTGETDREADVNRKLMGFIMENRRRNSLSLDGPRPWLVEDSEESPRDSSELSGSDRRGFWTQFAAVNRGFDFARTELTLLKMKLVESLTLAWSPRTDSSVTGAFVRRMSQNVRPFELSPLLSQETMPLDNRHLETIFSAEPTPFIDAPAPDAEPALTSFVCLDAVSACLTVQPDGFALSTTLRVCRQKEQARFSWPAFVDLDFSPLLVAIGPVRSVDLHHQRVSIDGCSARWSSARDLPAHSSFSSSFSSMSSSCLRIWIPDSTDASAPVSVVVESALALHIDFSGMALTKSFFVAVPMHRLARIVYPLSQVSGDADVPAAATVTVANAADMWVNAVQTDSKGMGLGAFSLAPLDSSSSSSSSPELFQVVTIERKVSPIAASFSQRLATAFAVTDRKNNNAQPVFATALGISVDVEHGVSSATKETNADSLSEELVVRVAINCSLATFSPWRWQLACPNAAPSSSFSTMPCLAMKLPGACGLGSKWVLESLELALPAGQGHSKVPVQTVIDLSDDLIAVPLLQMSRLSKGPANSSLGLHPEVTIDSVTCLFKSSMHVSVLEEWPCLHLPAPHFAQIATSQGPQNAVFAQASSALLDSASVTVSSSSGGNAVQLLKHDEQEGIGIDDIGIECAVDMDPCKPLIAQKLHVALDDIGKLILCLRSLPALKPKEFATKATETNDLKPPAAADSV